MVFARVCMVVIATLSMARFAHAEDPPMRKPRQASALEHLAQATKLYNVRSFEEAADEYKAGALIEAAPVFDYNLGQCYRQLHRYEDAIWHYQRFVSQSPETPEHVEASQKFIAQMRAELDHKAMTEPPVDDGTATHARVDTPAQQSVAPAPLPITTRPSVEPWYDDGLGWGLAGVGLVSVGISAALLFDSSSLNDDANHATTQTDANGLHDTANTRALLGTVLGIGGVGLLVTGVLKLAIHPSGSNLTAAWNVGVVGNGVVVSGTF